MANVLSKESQLAVIHLLVEGNSIRSIERLTGVQKKTVMRLLVKFGNACKNLMDERMRDLQLRHVQVDEIWTFVAKKESRIPEAEKTYAQGDQFVYVALDQDTKLMASFAIGKRSADLTRRFMVDLRSRVITGNIFNGEPVVQVSTDGFTCYPEAVDLAFGPHVRYGSIVKEFRNAGRNYVPSEIVGSKRRGIFNISSKREVRTICTSHVERSNLTIRTFIKRFTRLTLSFSKKLENLAAAVAIHAAHYNFCRKHSTIKTAPAVAAGVIGDIWTLEELYDRAMECL